MEAGSFLGSVIVDKLLTKGLQVLGIDDLNSHKNNLSKATENKNFHLINENLSFGDLELERLDYIFITARAQISLKKVLELFKKHHCRLLFISSIDLYESDKLDENLGWLKKAEEEIARVSHHSHLNARILRLGPLYGPRMDFDRPPGEIDPIVRLIAQSINGDLQKEISLEFSTRALYIDDAGELAVRCIMAGATAQKIFDGVLPAPIKISEIKQVLLDPIWHENKNFEPSELPPWSTPNLEKTINFLNWHPKSKLVENLKNTLSYFKDNEIKVPDLEDEKQKIENGREEKVGEDWKEEKATELASFKGVSRQKVLEKPKDKKGINLPKFFLPTSTISVILTLVLITYALIWPLVALGWGVLTFRFQLAEAVKNLQKGEFDKSLFNVVQAKNGVEVTKSIFLSLEPLRKTGILKAQFETGDNLSKLASLSVDSARETILGIQTLYQSLKSISGEEAGFPREYFDLSRTYLASADENVSKAEALIASEDFKTNLPGVFSSRVSSLSQRLSVYSDLIKKARSIATLLPEVVALEGSKNYLILLQNNGELRPTGGFIGSFAKVGFEGGKLKKLEVNDIYAIDGQLKLHVEPPKEIKEDLGVKDYFLRDSNWEPDFPTAARQAEWFYAKETGERVQGVIAMDVSAMEDLLTVVGELDLSDYNEKITADNLFEKSVTYAEVNFFPGTQAKKGFITALSQALFNKLFFLPNQNWPGIVASLGRSLEGKHLGVYLSDPKLFSYIVSQNWGGVLPRAGSEKGKQINDFLALVEANLGANKANFYLDRSYNLETTFGKDGEVSHRLRISYTNRSPANVFPAGKYKNRMRVYLPFGTKLSRVLWGEKDITKSVTSFVDYGRSAYSFLLELAPKQQQTLILDYQTPGKLIFESNKASYRLDVVKQAGTLKDPFVWTTNYPLNLKLASEGEGQIAPQQQIITTDLSKDRSFEVGFTK